MTKRRTPANFGPNAPTDTNATGNARPGERISLTNLKSAPSGALAPIRKSSVHFELNFFRRPVELVRAVVQDHARMLVVTTAASPKLSALEIEVIDFFVELSALLGQPRSLAEIYGLLFISPHPLTMDDFVERLELSKGSASQGLKFLRDLGAVHEVDIPGDRRTHYEAVAELRKLAAQFLRGQFGPRLDSGLNRLDRIASLAKSVPAADREKLQHRVALLKNWGKRGKLLLPLIIKLMGK